MPVRIACKVTPPSKPACTWLSPFPVEASQAGWRGCSILNKSRNSRFIWLPLCLSPILFLKEYFLLLSRSEECVWPRKESDQSRGSPQHKQQCFFSSVPNSKEGMKPTTKPVVRPLVFPDSCLWKQDSKEASDSGKVVFLIDETSPSSLFSK